MNQQMVLCPNKECKHEFPTRIEEAQCWKCKERFYSLKNLLDSKQSQKVIIKEQSGNRFKKIENMLEKLSSKHEETGIDIREIRKITKESIMK